MRGTSALLSAFWTLLFLFIHPIIAATPAPDFLPQVTYPPIPSRFTFSQLTLASRRDSSLTGTLPGPPFRYPPRVGLNFRSSYPSLTGEFYRAVPNLAYHLVAWVYGRRVG